MSNILLVYTPGDMHGEAVRWALRSRGVPCDVWHFSEFPGNARAAIRVTASGERIARLQATPEDGRLERYDVVWMRRLGRPGLAAETHSGDRKFVRQESLAFLRNLRSLVGHAGTRWVNEPGAAAMANNKLHQLRVARQCGFAIPDTLVSNDAAEVRAFYADHGPHVIMKPFGSFVWRNDKTGMTSYSLTAELKQSDLDDPRPIELVPAIYQPRIDVDYELRVTAFGDCVLAARIDSQAHGRATDWRHDVHYGIAPVHAIELPEDIRRRCLDLLHGLGLSFGCIDVIVARNGDYVFLEVNEAGQFLWKEEYDAGLPMLREFCRFLAVSAGHAQSMAGVAFSEFTATEAFRDANEIANRVTGEEDHYVGVE